MSGYIVTFKPEATDEEMKKVKDDIKAKGGTIGHEYTLIKGFSVQMPEVSTAAVTALATHPKVENVEKDQEMRIQK